MKALLSAIFFLVALLPPIHIMAQSGTDDCSIKQIDSETDPVKLNGYRHNVDVVGTDVYLYGETAYYGVIEMRLYINGAYYSGAYSWWIDYWGEWSCYFPAPAPCQKFTVEVWWSKVFQEGWSEPVEMYSVSGANNDCTPECTECDMTASGQAAGYPVNVVTGKMFYKTHDLSMGGVVPFSFGRHYDNQRVYNKDLGNGWRHNFSNYLDLTSTNPVKYYDENGDVIWYTKNTTGAYARDWTRRSRITPPGSYWQVNTFDNVTYRFDSGGRLTTVIEANGDTYTIARDGSNRISTITDAIGRSYTFAYGGSGTKIQSVTTNPGGAVISFGYTGDNLTSYTDPEGKTWTYQYNDTYDSTNLTAVIDPLGHVAEQHTYYSDDKTATSSKDSGQESFSFTYAGTTTTATDSLSNVTTYNWNQNLKVVTQISGPGCGCGGGQSKSYVWSNTLNKLMETDALGTQTVYAWYYICLPVTYDCYWGQYFPTHDINWIKEAAGKTEERLTTFTNYYDLTSTFDDARRGLWQTKTQKSVDTPANNITTTRAYDTSRNLTSKAVAGYVNGTSETHTETWTYASHSRPLVYNGPRTDVTDTTTNAYYADTETDLAKKVQLYTITNALSQVTTFNSYHFSGQATSVTDPNNVNQELAFNNRGRITSQILHAETDQTTTYSYYDDGLLHSVLHPEGNYTEYLYDPQHRLTDSEEKWTLAGHGHRAHFTFDTQGNKTKEEYQYWDGVSSYVTTKQTDFVYDGYNRLWKIVNPDATFTARLYDANGNLQYLDDADHPYPGSGNHYVTNTYDNLNHLKTTTIMNGAVSVLTQYAYDRWDDLTSVIDPENHTIAYTFDDFARLRQTVSPDSGTTNRTFDLSGNTLTETDALGITTTRTYDALNRTSTVTYPNSSYNVSLYYDEVSADYGVGGLSTVTDSAGTTTFDYFKTGLTKNETISISGTPYTTAYTFDKNNNLTNVTYPDGRLVGYTVNAVLGKPTSISAIVNSSPQTILTGGTYYPFGPLSSATFGNGLSLSRSYDLKYRPSSNANGPISVSYTPDYEMNILAISGTYSRGYGYDNLYRLTGATGPWGTKTYSYDKNGNRLTKVLGATTTYNYQATTNRLTSTTGAEPDTFTLNSDGSVTADTLHTYQYGDHGHMVSVDSGSTASYYYDYEMRRRKAVYPSKTVLFFYDIEGRMIAEKDSSTGYWTDYIFNGLEPVAQIAQAATWYTLGNYLRADKTGGYVHLDWSLYGGSETFRVYRSTNDFTFSSPSMIQELTPKTYDDNVLGNSNNYAYKIFKNAVGDVPYYYHTDHLMTPLAMTNVSQSTVWQASYYPFGRLYSTSGSVTNNLRFPGQYADAAIDNASLYYNGFRWYGSKQGRYFSFDPYRSLRKTDHFSYAYLNPISFSDFLGLDVILSCRPVQKAGLGKLGFKHCYITLTCKDQPWDGVRVGLSERAGANAKVVENHVDDVGGDSSVVSSNDELNCCQMETCIRDAYMPYKDKAYMYGPVHNNSNTFAFTLLRRCGVTPPKVSGAQGQNDTWDPVEMSYGQWK